MLPALTDGVLPPGRHPADRKEVERVFGWSPHRLYLLDGFSRGVESLGKAGCQTLWLDGSFVTDKPVPSDFDACWDPAGVDLSLVDPVLLRMDPGRRSQKLKFGGEFLPNIVEAGSGLFFREFFQLTRDGIPKGIVEVDPRSWT